MTRYLIIEGEHGLVEVDGVELGRGKVTVTSVQREMREIGPAVPSDPTHLEPPAPMRLKVELLLELAPGDQAQIIRPAASIAKDDWCERIEAPGCARCRDRRYVPDWSRGLDPVYGEPGKKPCPDCVAPPAPKAPAQNVRLTRVVQTCRACPSQWNAWDAAGRYYYLKYRSGLGTVQLAQSPDDMALADRHSGLVASFQHGDRYAGEIDLTEFLQRAGIQLAPGAHVTELGGAGELPSEHHPSGGQS